MPASRRSASCPRRRPSEVSASALRSSDVWLSVRLSATRSSFEIEALEAGVDPGDHIGRARQRLIAQDVDRTELGLEIGEAGLDRANRVRGLADGRRGRAQRATERTCGRARDGQDVRRLVQGLDDRIDLDLGPLRESIDATAHPDQGEEPEQRDHEAQGAIDQQSARQPAQTGSETVRALRARAHLRYSKLSPMAVGMVRTSGISSFANAVNASGGSMSRFG